MTAMPGLLDGDKATSTVLPPIHMIILSLAQYAYPPFLGDEHLDIVLIPLGMPCQNFSLCSQLSPAPRAARRAYIWKMTKTRTPSRGGGACPPGPQPRHERPARSGGTPRRWSWMRSMPGGW